MASPYDQMPSPLNGTIQASKRNLFYDVEKAFRASRVNSSLESCERDWFHDVEDDFFGTIQDFKDEPYWFHCSFRFKAIKALSEACWFNRYSESRANRRQFWSPSRDYTSARASNTSQFDPASHRRLTYPAGGFHQQDFFLNEINTTSSISRCFHTSVVHDQRLLNSTRVEEQPLHHRVWVPSTHPWSPSQLHPGNHSQLHPVPITYSGILAMLNEIQHTTGVEEQPLFNRPKLPETFLGITSQVALTMLTIWISGSTSFSQNAKILFCSAAACNVISFLFCLFSILLYGRKTGVAARIVTGTGFVFTAYGFLAIMGMLLSDNIMLWVTGLACIACFPALASAFME